MASPSLPSLRTTTSPLRKGSAIGQAWTHIPGSKVGAMLDPLTTQIFPRKVFPSPRPIPAAIRAAPIRRHAGVLQMNENTPANGRITFSIPQVPCRFYGSIKGNAAPPFNVERYRTFPDLTD